MPAGVINYRTDDGGAFAPYFGTCGYRSFSVITMSFLASRAIESIQETEHETLDCRFCLKLGWNGQMSHSTIIQSKHNLGG